MKGDLGDAPLGGRAAGGGGGHLEGGEADAAHERDLVGEDVADCAQFARETVLVAHEPGGGESTTVGELGEVEGDQGEVRKIGGNIVDAFAGFQVETERGVALGERLAL